MARSITIQGRDRNGWDTETVNTMEGIHAYLMHPHKGEITAYIDGKAATVPVGIGARYTPETRTINGKIHDAEDLEA